MLSASDQAFSSASDKIVPEQMPDTFDEQYFFGDYRMIQLIGRGGFCEVYLAKHRHLGTQVAIKLPADRLKDEDDYRLKDEDIELFLQAARIVARLKHPHIVQVLDFGIEKTVPFLRYCQLGT